MLIFAYDAMRLVGMIVICIVILAKAICFCYFHQDMTRIYPNKRYPFSPDLAGQGRINPTD